MCPPRSHVSKQAGTVLVPQPPDFPDLEPGPQELQLTHGCPLLLFAPQPRLTHRREAPPSRHPHTVPSVSLSQCFCRVNPKGQPSSVHACITVIVVPTGPPPAERWWSLRVLTPFPHWPRHEGRKSCHLESKEVACFLWCMYLVCFSPSAALVSFLCVGSFPSMVTVLCQYVETSFSQFVSG